MSSLNLSVLNWNVRGLNCPNRRAAVNTTIAASACQLACLQESKLETVDASTAAFLGGYRLKGFAQRPALGTRGGILMLWDDEHVRVENVHYGDYTLSARITIIATDTSFKLTTVYGPTRDNLKDVFFQEMKDAKPHLGERWLVAGDFNQIYRARDKNRSNANRSRITRFRNALNFCELKEIHLQNRRFTWSNEQRTTRPCPSLMVSFAMRNGISLLISTSFMPYPLLSPTIAPFSWQMMTGLGDLGLSASRTFGPICRAFPRLSMMLGMSPFRTMILTEGCSRN